IVLLIVAAPTLGVRWSGVDATVLPTGQSARVVSDRLMRDFPPQELNPITIAARAPASAGPQLAAYATRLRSIPGVTVLSPPAYLGGGTWELALAGAGDPIASRAQRTIDQVRATPAPLPVEVGGPAAEFHDQQSS